MEGTVREKPGGVAKSIELEVGGQMSEIRGKPIEDRGRKAKKIEFRIVNCEFGNE